MRYLRMLTNAVAGGVLGAAYLAVLVLQLNPQVPAGSITAVRWFGTLVMFYGLYLSVAVYVLLLIRELLAYRPLSPGWLSVRLLAWVGTAEATAASVITWANLKGFRAMLSDAAAERLRQGATALTIFAAVLLTVAILRYSFGRRGTRAAAVLLIAATVLSVTMPLWLRGPGELPVPTPSGPSRPPPATTPGPAPAPPHVRLLLLDGAAMRFIRQRVAAGQLPNFGNLLDRGAAIDLATLKPTQADTVWAAAATGKYPPKNGIRSRIRRIQPDDVNPVDLLPDYCFAQGLVVQNFVTEDEYTSASLRARPMWEILADYRLASGVLNWPVSYPARVDFGYLVSDQFDEGQSYPLRLAQAGWPTTATAIAREAFDAWQARSWSDIMTPAPSDEIEPLGLQRARWDRAYSAAALELNREFPVQMTAMRYEGLDVFGHAALREAEPELFGQIGRGDPHRSLLDRYYAFVDLEVGRLIDDLAPGDLLLVVSGFGMERETFLKQLVARARGEPERPGSHDRAPDGFLLAFGANVAPNQSLPRGAIVDVAPTVLYYLGIPIGRDMDGFARADLFRRSYTVEHPVTYIATHER
jgi:predicted AlkP superfamily phosphohydrolase/phosphomutase